MKRIYTSLKPFFAAILFLSIGVFFSHANAQTGYIYVHKKALDESSSLDFSFSVSGGSTVVPNFSLNDKPSQIPLADIGSSRSGRLWAVSQDGAIYYRNINSAKWIATTVTSGALRIDGGDGSLAYYTTSTGVYLFDGTISTLIYVGATADVASGWDDKPYIVDDYGNILRYSGILVLWDSFFSSPDWLQHIDVSPSDGNVYVTNTSGVNAYVISPAGVETTMGSPADVSSYFNDIAVDALGNVFISAYSDVANSTQVYKWGGGTLWNASEPTAAYSSMITGGLGGQMWTIMALDNSSPTYFNIFSRSSDGSNNWWIDDERVRTDVTNGNSQMIAVAPGTYTITENVPAGWDLNKVSIYDPSSNSTSNVNANTATITVAANEVVHVVFQDGVVNPFSMTNSCANAYTEDFGSGATGTYGAAFIGQTPYHYLGDATPASDGYYKVVSQAFPDFNTWQDTTFYDHTSNNGTGRMLAVNAAFDQSEFFRRRFINVIPGATYNFSAWIANLTPYAPIKPNVSFQVVDPTTNTVIASNTTGDLTGATTEWDQYSLSFLATSTVIDLMLVNNNIGGSGNDLAIDDISFSMEPVPAPITTVTNTGCGTLGKITVTFPLGVGYEYSIDSFATAPHASPVFANLNAGIYTTSVRFVGTVACFRSKTDTVGATICGNIWDDANGNAINNSENPITSGVWINLVDPSTHAVLQSVQVDASGNYSLTGLPLNTGYQIILSNANQTGNTNLTSATLPSRYTVTGTNLNSTPNTTDTTGVININTGSGGTTLLNIGIEKLPNTNAEIQLLAHPSGANIPPGTITTPVSGTDTEDGTLSNSSKIAITNLPANATMLYNGVAITAGQQITGFNPSLVSFTGIAIGSTSVVFSYAFTDAAGKQDPTPATYTLNWLGALAINLESFTVSAKDCNSAILKWKVSGAVNFSRFEIERSINGIDFKTLGVIFYDATITDYQFSENFLDNGAYQYRLKMVDIDGKITYSPIIFVQVDCSRQSALFVYPNPTTDKVTIKGLNVGEQITMYTTAGQIIQSRKATQYQISIDMTALANGTYYIIVTNKSGEKISESKIVKVNR